MVGEREVDYFQLLLFRKQQAWILSSLWIVSCQRPEENNKKRVKEVGEREKGKHKNLVNLAKFNEYLKWTNEYLNKVAKKYRYQHGSVLLSSDTRRAFRVLSLSVSFQK